MDTRTATDSCRPGLKADNKIAICSSTNIELVLKSLKVKILKCWKEKKNLTNFENSKGEKFF